METVDYIYRFDPKNPGLKAPPADAEAAKLTLEEGNRMFSRWMASCRATDLSLGDPRYVVHCNGFEVGMILKQDRMPRQAPFAVVVGCSDARVPTEMLFGQGFNDLFVVRVAGNVLGEVCLGSIDFALTALIESVKVVVMLGHSGCGAVSAAVDSYLEPLRFWSKTTSPALRAIQERLFVAVREAAKGLDLIWGSDASSSPGYRTALIESAVALNAAQSSFDLRQEAEKMGTPNVQILFGVFDLHNHQVSMPVIPDAEVSDENVRLSYAPKDPSEFPILANRMAELLKPKFYHPAGKM